MSAATMNEMERLRRERDSLAAHVAACHALMEEMPRRSLAWQVNAMVDLKAEAPEAGLARLKAQWAQEGARAAAQAIRLDYEGAIHADDIADFVDEIADDYRRQAEESDQ